MAYGKKLRRYVLWAALVAACVFALCILTGQPWFAVLYAYPVMLLAALLGLRVGLGAGALATGLAVVGGELGGGAHGPAVYLGLGLVLLLCGVLGGLARFNAEDLAGADEESGVGRGLRGTLGTLLMLNVLGGLLGVAPAPASSSPLQYPPVFEQRLEVEADAPSAQCSTEAALMAAFSGLLTSQRFELADVDAEHQAGCCEALRALNALVAEPGPDRAEAREIASGLRAEVASRRVDAVAVVAALDHCDDPLLGIRAVAFQLGTLSSPLKEAAERVARFAESADEVGEMIRLFRGTKKKTKEEKSLPV